MEMVTLRNRAGSPYNFDQLYLRGVDIGAMLSQIQGTNNMATSSVVVSVTERYTATGAGVGYVIGQLIGRTELIDTSTTPPISTVHWFNYSTGTSLTVEPLYSNLLLQYQTGITNAELRATPLTVKTDLSSPELTRMGDVTDAMVAADGSGVLTVLGGLRRMVNTFNSISTRLPASLGQKTAAASIPVVINSDAWEDGGFTMDVNGNITREVQVNGTQSRYRNWNLTSDGLGNSTNTPGTWTVV